MSGFEFFGPKHEIISVCEAVTDFAVPGGDELLVQQTDDDGNWLGSVPLGGRVVWSSSGGMLVPPEKLKRLRDWSAEPPISPESERAANRIKWGLDTPKGWTDEEAAALARVARLRG